MTTDAATRPFDLGRVIQRTFGVTRRNLAVFGPLAVAFVGVPGTAASLLQNWAMQRGPEAAVAVFMGGGALTLLVSLVLGLMLQAALVHGTVSDLNGRRPTIGECLSIGLRRFFTVLGIAVVWVLAVVLAGIVLVVLGGLASIGGAAMLLLAMLALIGVGLFAATIWSVAVPAAVVERRGVFGAFGRSVTLTRGARWLILALLLIYGVFAIVLLTVVALIGGVAGSVAGGSLLLLGVFNALGSTLTTLISAVGAAAIYVELRERREGVTPSDLASVFA